MDFSRKKNLYVVFLLLTALAGGISFVLQAEKKDFLDQPAAVLAQSANLKESSNYKPPKKLENPPEIIKGIYVTAWSAGSKKYLNYLTSLFEQTEINAVVIDIKDSSGLIGYSSAKAIGNIDSLVNFLHSKNIYVIGRISVFEDPAYAKANPLLAVYNKEKTKDLKNPVLWQDNNGLYWTDPSSKQVWDYNVSLAKDVLSHGFDEINFDYIRFPSDGKTKNMGFPAWSEKVSKRDVIREFFNYLRAELPGEKISADLFGQTTVNPDDMGIGQKIEDAFLPFDFVSPMVYPSHYINGFIGFKNPAEHPYDVVKYSMDRALERQVEYVNNYVPEDILQMEVGAPEKIAKFRPWIQDFTMGAVYDAQKVQQEIQAVKNALGNEFYGFLLWNPSNIYTSEAVLK